MSIEEMQRAHMIKATNKRKQQIRERLIVFLMDRGGGEPENAIEAAKKLEAYILGENN